MKSIELDESLFNDVQARKDSIREALFEWGRKHFRAFAWRRNRTPYSVLISEVLLKRTTASATTHVYEKFLALYPNIEILSKANKAELVALLSRIGYHKRRAMILVEMANYLMTKYQGRIPKSREELLEIPFIGHYTANAIISLGYGIPSAMVDSNVERIIKRLFLNHLSKKASLRIIQKVADILSPRENNQNYNYALLDFGAAICRYVNPKCQSCPINGFCDYNLSRKASSN